MKRACNFCTHEARANVQHGEYFCSFKGRCLRCGHLVDNGFKHGHYECYYPAFDFYRRITFRKGSHLPEFPYTTWKRYDRAHLRQLTFEALVCKRLFKGREFSRWFVKNYIERPSNKSALVVARLQKIQIGLIIVIMLCFILFIVLLYYIPVMST